MDSVQDLIETFTTSLIAAAREETWQELFAAMGGKAPKNGHTNGHTNGHAKANGHIVNAKPRRKAPPQFCPVPRCRGVAAPVFGMVCSRHKDVPKATIAKYREARRARKAA